MSKHLAVTEAPIEDLQKAHFNQMSDAYDAHYSETYTNAYRTHFVDEPLVKGLDLNHKQVLEAMCGSGQTTAFLQSKGAIVTGLDISESLITLFQQKYPEATGICASVFQSGLPDASFDVVVIVAGLHHLHPKVFDALEECYRVLKPGGYLVFMEPHTGSLPNMFRKLWYKLDRMFESNEAAVDVAAIQSHFGNRFRYISQSYTGGLAFLFVFNSYIFRIPNQIKKYYAPFLLGFERIMSPLFTKQFSCITVCQWQKNK